MPIRWTDEALEDLRAIFDALAQTSPHYAGRALERITGQLERVERFPRLGRRVEELGFEQIREVLVPPYRLIYRLIPSGIEVITITRAAERLI